MVVVGPHGPIAMELRGEPSVSWTPAPLTPVWSGFDDFSPSDGAPMDVRVWFPSVTPGGSLLRDRGRFPLIVLVNGQCREETTPPVACPSEARVLTPGSSRLMR